MGTTVEVRSELLRSDYQNKSIALTVVVLRILIKDSVSQRVSWKMFPSEMAKVKI